MVVWDLVHSSAQTASDHSHVLVNLDTLYLVILAMVRNISVVNAHFKGL